MNTETASPRYNYYEILEINTNSAQHEVTTAYELAKSTYSGENPAIYTIFSEREARELLSLIEEAYSVLGNKTLRNIYDQRLLGQASQNQDLSYQSILQASRQVFSESLSEAKSPAFVKDNDFEKQITTQTVWSGDFLKKVREYKNMTVVQMSHRTKINQYYISAIEEMNPKSLPAIVFVRGYVLQIAKELHLPEKLVADSYMSQYKLAIKN
jgi:DnaJ-class molecular chaperone